MPTAPPDRPQSPTAATYAHARGQRLTTRRPPDPCTGSKAHTRTSRAAAPAGSARSPTLRRVRAMAARSTAKLRLGGGGTEKGGTAVFRGCTWWRVPPPGARVAYRVAFGRWFTDHHPLCPARRPSAPPRILWQRVADRVRIAGRLASDDRSRKRGFASAGSRRGLAGTASRPCKARCLVPACCYPAVARWDEVRECCRELGAALDPASMGGW